MAGLQAALRALDRQWHMRPPVQLQLHGCMAGQYSYVLIGRHLVIIITIILMGQLPLLLPNHQCKSTEWKYLGWSLQIILMQEENRTEVDVVA